jgi:hypothetical protein
LRMLVHFYAFLFFEVRYVRCIISYIHDVIMIMIMIMLLRKSVLCVCVWVLSWACGWRLLSNLTSCFFITRYSLISLFSYLYIELGRGHVDETIHKGSRSVR